jgi:hypothetical protein
MAWVRDPLLATYRRKPFIYDGESFDGDAENYHLVYSIFSKAEKIMVLRRALNKINQPNFPDATRI